MSLRLVSIKAVVCEFKRCHIKKKIEVPRQREREKKKKKKQCCKKNSAAAAECNQARVA